MSRSNLAESGSRWEMNRVPLLGVSMLDSDDGIPRRRKKKMKSSSIDLATIFHGLRVRHQARITEGIATVLVQAGVRLERGLIRDENDERGQQSRSDKLGSTTSKNHPLRSPFLLPSQLIELNQTRIIRNTLEPPSAAPESYEQSIFEPEDGFDFSFLDFGGGGGEDEVDQGEVNEPHARFASINSDAWAAQVFSPLLKAVANDDHNSKSGEGEGEQEEDGESDHSSQLATRSIRSILGQRSATRLYGSRKKPSGRSRGKGISQARKRQIAAYTSSSSEGDEDREDAPFELDSEEEEAEFTPGQRRNDKIRSKPRRPLKYPRARDLHDASSSSPPGRFQLYHHQHHLDLDPVSQLDTDDQDYYEAPISPRKSKHHKRTRSRGVFLGTIDATSFALRDRQDEDDDDGDVMAEGEGKESPVKKITSRTFDPADIENSQPLPPPLRKVSHVSPRRLPKQRSPKKGKPAGWRLPRLDLSFNTSDSGYRENDAVNTRQVEPNSRAAADRKSNQLEFINNENQSRLPNPLEYDPTTERARRILPDRPVPTKTSHIESRKRPAQSDHEEADHTVNAPRVIHRRRISFTTPPVAPFRFGGVPKVPHRQALSLVIEAQESIDRDAERIRLRQAIEREEETKRLRAHLELVTEEEMEKGREYDRMRREAADRVDEMEDVVSEINRRAGEVVEDEELEYAPLSWSTLPVVVPPPPAPRQPSLPPSSPLPRPLEARESEESIEFDSQHHAQPRVIIAARQTLLSSSPIRLKYVPVKSKSLSAIRLLRRPTYVGQRTPIRRYRTTAVGSKAREGTIEKAMQKAATLRRISFAPTFLPTPTPVEPYTSATSVVVQEREEEEDEEERPSSEVTRTREPISDSPTPTPLPVPPPAQQPCSMHVGAKRTATADQVHSVLPSPTPRFVRHRTVVGPIHRTRTASPDQGGEVEEEESEKYDDEFDSGRDEARNRVPPLLADPNFILSLPLSDESRARFRGFNRRKTTVWGGREVEGLGVVNVVV